MMECMECGSKFPGEHKKCPVCGSGCFSRASSDAVQRSERPGIGGKSMTWMALDDLPLPQEQWPFRRPDAYKWTTLNIRSGSLSQAVGPPVATTEGNAKVESHAAIATLVVENERLKRELHRRTTRFNPASGRDEPFDPEALLDEIRAQIPREPRFEGFTLVGAVAEMVRRLSALQYLCDDKNKILNEIHAEIPPEYGRTLMATAVKKMRERLDKGGPSILATLDYNKVDRSTVITVHVDESIPTHKAIALARDLGDAIQRHSGFTVPVVVASTEFHITFGRRPVAMPEHVRAAYAEAAAADYGVTPEVVQAKKAERRRQARECGIAKPVTPPPEPRPPFGSPGIGRDIIPYPDSEET